MSRLHACRECGLMHVRPKVRTMPLALLRASLFIFVEVAAAFHTDGILHWALWGIAVWNVYYIALIVLGLSLMAAGKYDPNMQADS